MFSVVPPSPIAVPVIPKVYVVNAKTEAASQVIAPVNVFNESPLGSEPIC
jgi:hypothetical protein